VRALPTECTIDSAIAEIGDQARQVAGRAVGTARIYIVDDQLQLQPPPFVGEVCIGGLGVAQGYVGQPAFTSERFHQVKVRGLRIEPGEVEGALLGHPAVVRAAVIATEAGTRMAQLVAFLVVEGEGGDGLTASAVREFLRGRLPAAMLPDCVVILDTFPITANGKLDRKALLELKPSADESPDTGSSDAGPDADRAVTNPVDAREQALCEIVAEVLGLPTVDAGDSFFALGGNSLLAMQVTGRVRSILGCEMKLRTVFASPTIGDMVALLTTADSAPRPLLRRKENP
jgi:hypothetical protein